MDKIINTGTQIAAESLKEETRRGRNNIITGDHSVILGGTGNNDGGWSYAGIFGNGIAAQCDNMFHVNCLWAGSMPCLSAGIGTLVTGTFYIDDVNFGFQCAVMIK
jgi:hypothetical protein